MDGHVATAKTALCYASCGLTSDTSPLVSHISDNKYTATDHYTCSQMLYHWVEWGGIVVRWKNLLLCVSQNGLTCLFKWLRLRIAIVKSKSVHIIYIYFFVKEYEFFG